MVTVPAYFNDRQRQATRDAVSLAGLHVARLLNEPTAAALAYGLARDEAQTVMVWDLGGSTFDVSILELGEGIFEVRAVSGDNSLGGDDFDQRVAEWLAAAYRRRHDSSYPQDPGARVRLREAAERAKVGLSRAAETRVFLPCVERSPGPRHLDAVLSRLEFEDLVGDLLQRLGPPTRQAMADAGLTAAAVDTVILAGNGTRLPAVRRVVTGIMGQEPYRFVDPDLVTAVGAAIQAGWREPSRPSSRCVPPSPGTTPAPSDASVSGSAASCPASPAIDCHREPGSDSPRRVPGRRPLHQDWCSRKRAQGGGSWQLKPRVTRW